MHTRREKFAHLVADIAARLSEGEVITSDDLGHIAEEHGYSWSAGYRLRAMISSGSFAEITGIDIGIRFRSRNQPVYFYSKQAEREQPQKVAAGIQNADDELRRRDLEAVQSLLRLRY